MVIFNSAITRIKSFKKTEYNQELLFSYRIEKNFKKRVGTKWLVFPVYEYIRCVTVTGEV